MSLVRACTFCAASVMTLTAVALNPALDARRAEWIVQAFNQQPEKIFEPLTLQDVKIRGGQGRVDVNKKAKFSYFIQTEDSADPQSRMILIPMATSRFAPTYYQTDEWWDRYKNVKPMPKQPIEDVEKFLGEMKLSTNPDVLILEPRSGKVTRRPLQNFLAEIYLQEFARNGVITLYRGAEKENETSLWNQSVRPPGGRYWTPTANYAWRYARKNLNFIEELVEGRAPLLKFEIPAEEFRQMTAQTWPSLTLGTELTKNVHQAFEMSGRFMDQLAPGQDYLGVGNLAVEFEIRANRRGADSMARFYKGSIGISELAQDRIRVIRKATARLQKQRPSDSAALEMAADQRVARVREEAHLLLLIQNKGPEADIRQALARLKGTSELTMIDGFSFSRWVESRLRRGGFLSDFSVEKILEKSVQPLKSCLKVH
jgi:hypothetical protein